MSESFFDDLARTLARPMSRQRAVRLLGAALVTVAVPGLAPRSALAREQQCPEKWTCSDPGFKSVCKCPHPEVGGCASYNCCSGPAACVCDERAPNKGAACCASGYVVKVTKKGAPGEGPLGTCVKCPGSRLCGTQCCPVGQKCTWSNGKRTCCPSGRIVSKGSNRFCCPSGTVAVEKGSACCPPGDRTCCKQEGEDLTGLGARMFCVRGKFGKL
jgi:hypothetical protein